MLIQTINPASGEPLSEYKMLTSAEIKQKVIEAADTFVAWSQLGLQDRIQYFRQLITVLNAEKENCAVLAALEMGKPIQFARAEIEKCIYCCRYYIDNAEDFLNKHYVATEFASSFITYQPQGSILAIMPWNFPFWQVLRFVVPTIIAGNVVLLKHASQVAGCAKKIEGLFTSADFPKGVMTNLCIAAEQVEAIIAEKSIRGVTLTGSEAVGRKVASIAGWHLKKVALELGGNDACLVLADANLKQAAQAIVASRLRNSGQVCIATKRVIADAAIHDELVQLIRQEMQQYEMDNPLNENCNFGPMAREDLRDELDELVKKMQTDGAVLLEGGYIPAGQGFYYPPTLLINVDSSSIAFQQELFGPVIAVSKFNDINDGIAMANNTDYGLGGNIFSANIKLASQLAEKTIEAGACFVNLPVTSDPRLPFGGIKNSGYGRELSREGMLEFMNVKTVIINE